MKRRPPSARACSLRGKRLLKSPSKRASDLLRECAATPKRSKRMAPKGGATKAACSLRGRRLTKDKTPRAGVLLAECRAPAKKRAFASRHGRTWKAALREKWAYDSSLSGPLRALRNRLGPRWLASFTLSR